MEITVKNKYDGVFSYVSGFVQGILVPESQYAVRITGPYSLVLLILSVYFWRQFRVCNLCRSTGSWYWSGGATALQVAGIDGFAITVDPNTNNTTEALLLQIRRFSHRLRSSFTDATWNLGASSAALRRPHLRALCPPGAQPLRVHAAWPSFEGCPRYRGVPAQSWKRVQFEAWRTKYADFLDRPQPSQPSQALLDRVQRHLPQGNSYGAAFSQSPIKRGASARRRRL